MFTCGAGKFELHLMRSPARKILGWLYVQVRLTQRQPGNREMSPVKL
jgi:hypothetical protein